MKKNLIIGAVGVITLLLSSCGTLVTTGPGVAVGGGIYPAPIMTPPPGGPFVFRPGAPYGPGFGPGPGPIASPPNPGGPIGGPGDGPGGPGGMGGPGGPGGPGSGPGGPGGPIAE